MLIGVNLVAEGLGFEIPRGYTYFAMAWSIAVEMLNLRFFRKRKMRLERESKAKLQKAGHGLNPVDPVLMEDPIAGLTIKPKAKALMKRKGKSKH